jgi:hypothetical protein
MAKARTKSKSKGGDVTIGDVLKGLEAMEKWLRVIRKSLKSMDQNQSLDVKRAQLRVIPMAREC